MGPRVADRLRRDVLLHLAAGALALVATGLLGRAAGWIDRTVVLGAVTIYGAAALAVVGWSVGHRPHDRFGPANRITLARLVAVSILGGLVFGPALSDGAVVAVIAISLALLALDGLDGRLARSSGLASPFGGRFDMETDALTVLVLASLLVATGRVGPWIIATGLLRYAFVAAGRWVPALARPLGPSRFRQTVCVLQELGLILALTPDLPRGVATLSAALALGLTSYSFGIDCVRLLRRPAGPEPA